MTKSGRKLVVLSPPRNADGRYGPTSRGHFYQPSPYHSRTSRVRPSKSRWAVKEGHQYLVFLPADEAFWHCKDGRGLFSIELGGKTILGRRGERLAFFPDPQNSTDPWHGFPVSSSERQPSPDVIDSWVRAGVISEHVRRKLEGGRL